MGANIGTTVTSFLIGLKISYLAPIAVFCRHYAMADDYQKSSFQHIGMVIIGFGILFTGMESMSGAMEPLAQMPEFASLMTKFSNPVLGILAGAVLTAVIQSSSASVGIIQALAASGAVNLGGVIYILFGQNIGTCATALLASIGTNRSGRGPPLIHLMFNVIGTLLFIPICLFFPYVELIEGFVADPKMQISVAHIIFNIVSTAVLLPFAQLLVKLAQKLIPGKDAAYEELRLQFLDERILNTPAIAVAQVTKEVERMAAIARNNFGLAMEVFFKPNRKPCNRSNRTSRCSIFSITASQAIW